MFNIELNEIFAAQRRLSGITHKTELNLSTTFSSISGSNVFLKCENLQKTGSFKIRGATNKISKLAEQGIVTSTVASSAGNHAQGVAYASTKFGIPSTIVMPKTAPLAKVQATEGYGAKVVLAGECYDDAYEEACRICNEEGATFIHPYNDADVMAGQGTLGIEILKELPDTDAIIVPVGGGGLLAGVACAVKQINPTIKVYGVQATGASAAVTSFKSGTLTPTDTVSTIADGIAVKCPGEICFDLISHYVDDMISVTDSMIAEAILLLLERAKQVVEPAGATPVAAILNKLLPLEKKNAVCVLSGGNIDVSFIQNIIELGLVTRHRRTKFTVKLVDRPGSLVSLLNIIAACGANILSIEHDKLSEGLNPNEITVHISCEVGGIEQRQLLYKAITDNKYILTSEY